MKKLVILGVVFFVFTGLKPTHWGCAVTVTNNKNELVYIILYADTFMFKTNAQGKLFLTEEDLMRHQFRLFKLAFQNRRDSVYYDRLYLSSTPPFPKPKVLMNGKIRLMDLCFDDGRLYVVRKPTTVK